MDYLERKYRGERKEKVLNAIVFLATATVLVCAGMIIFGFLKKDIIRREILFFIIFFAAFVLNVTMIFKSRLAHDFSRTVWLALEALFFFVFTIIALLVII